MNADDDLEIVFIPALVAVLLAAERAADRPLTEAEVLALRDEAACVTVARSVAEGMAADRGYDDLDPERCWEEWQQVRGQF